MKLRIEGTADYIIAKLDPLDREAAQKLKTVIDGLKEELVSKVKAAAPKKTGALANSIEGKTTQLVTGATASVFANPTGGTSKGSRQAYYALFQEFGANLPERDISAKDKPMAFRNAEGRMIFASKVHFPGAKISAEKFLHGPFKEMRARIIGEIRGVVDESIARTNS